MIPRNIARTHIEQAIEQIQQEGIPTDRSSRKYWLDYEGQLFPPKYVVSRANRFANGADLPPSAFSGGTETNLFLTVRGFKIVGSKGRAFMQLGPRPGRGKPAATPKHNEHCSECKVRIGRLLEGLYGRVLTNQRFEVATSPDDFRGMEYGEAIAAIHGALAMSRGHAEFVRSPTLPPVDYYVQTPGFVVEFDESQHFTAQRRLALQLYPENLALGFSRRRWVSLCDTIRARDPSPPFRDEQRAWYDTLRDFLPSIVGLRPTARLHAADFNWCQLDASSEADLAWFKSHLEVGSPGWRIEVRQDAHPSLARVIIAGEWRGDIDLARNLLEDVCSAWPEVNRVDCLVTCGAFLTFDWPNGHSDSDNTQEEEDGLLAALIQRAREQCDLLLDGELAERLRAFARYISIGVDSRKDRISLAQEPIRQPHIELVALVDLESLELHMTGKSFPTTGQASTLVRIPDIGSHFVDTSFGKLLLLGCHDLNAFSPRGRANTTDPWRTSLRDAFYARAKAEWPTTAIQHPHTTDSPRIWKPAWNELMRSVPSLNRYVSAGRYYHPERPRAGMGDVLAATKLGDTIDFVVWVDD